MIKNFFEFLSESESKKVKRLVWIADEDGVRTGEQGYRYGSAISADGKKLLIKDANGKNGGEFDLVTPENPNSFKKEKNKNPSNGNKENNNKNLKNNKNLDKQNNKKELFTKNNTKKDDREKDKSAKPIKDNSPLDSSTSLEKDNGDVKSIQSLIKNTNIDKAELGQSMEKLINGNEFKKELDSALASQNIDGGVVAQMKDDTLMLYCKYKESAPRVTVLKTLFDKLGFDPNATESITDTKGWIHTKNGAGKEIKRLKLHVVKGGLDDKGNVAAVRASTSLSAGSYISPSEEDEAKFTAKVNFGDTEKDCYVQKDVNSFKDLVLSNIETNQQFSDEQRQIIRDVFDAESKEDFDTALGRPGAKDLMASFSEIYIPAAMLKFKEEKEKNYPDEGKLKGFAEVFGMDVKDVPDFDEIVWSKDNSERGWDFALVKTTGLKTLVATKDKKAKEMREIVKQISIKTGGTKGGHAPDLLTKFEDGGEDAWDKLTPSQKAEHKKHFKQSLPYMITSFKMDFWNKKYGAYTSKEAKENNIKNPNKKNKVHCYLSFFLSGKSGIGKGGLMQEDIDKFHSICSTPEYKKLKGEGERAAAVLKEFNKSKDSKALLEKMADTVKSRVNALVKDEKKREKILQYCDSKNNKCWPLSITYAMLNTFNTIVSDKKDKNYDLNQEYLRHMMSFHDMLQMRTSYSKRDGVKSQVLEVSGKDTIDIETKTQDGPCEYEQSRGGWGLNAVAKSSPKVKTESLDISFGRYLI